MFTAAIVVAASGKHRVAIVQEVAGRLVLREGIPKLLGGPGRRGIT
jgi:hypothetical protein